jgi:hypothetical protein
MSNSSERMTHKVVRPVGEITVKPGRLAARLDSLDGKTICEAYNGMFQGDKTFPKIREVLKRRYPKINIIPYPELPPLDIVRIEDELKRLPDILRHKRCDGLITGNGG